MADTPDYVNGEPEPIHNFNPSIHDLLVNDAKHRILAFAGRHGPRDTIREQIIDLIRARKAYGLNKYGTVLQADNGRDFMKDGIDEAVDLLAYVRQGLEEAPRSQLLLSAYNSTVDALASLLAFKAELQNAEHDRIRKEAFEAAKTNKDNLENLVIHLND